MLKPRLPISSCNLDGVCIVQPDLFWSGSCWLSLPDVGFVVLVVLSSMLFLLGPVVVCVACGSGSAKWTFYTTAVGMAQLQ